MQPRANRTSARAALVSPGGRPRFEWGRHPKLLASLEFQVRSRTPHPRVANPRTAPGRRTTHDARGCPPLHQAARPPANAARTPRSRARGGTCVLAAPRGGLRALISARAAGFFARPKRAAYVTVCVCARGRAPAVCRRPRCFLDGFVLVALVLVASAGGPGPESGPC